MASPYIGEIRMFAGNFAIQGWQMCNGQTLPIAQYAALFSILGTTYGGNGVSTFCLPDFRGRVPNHSGQGPGTSNYVLGEFGGSETVTLTLSQMPGHNHLVTADGTAADTIASNPADHFLGPTGLNLVGARDIYSKSSPPLANPATMNAQMIGVTGGSQPHPNLQPYLTVTFLIAMVGIFPSRN